MDDVTRTNPSVDASPPTPTCPATVVQTWQTANATKDDLDDGFIDHVLEPDLASASSSGAPFR